MGPCPHSAPSPDSDTRSLPSVTLASAQPPFTSPTRFFAGRRTSSRNTSLKAWSPVMSTMGRIVTPGASIGHTKYEMPRCFSTSGSVRASRIPNAATWAKLVHTFWPVTTHSSPSRTARVDSPARSEPAPGSENSWHQISSPANSGRR